MTAETDYQLASVVWIILGQRAIAAHLETAKLDRLLERVEAALTALREYRIALITTVVTGKIDVRHASKSD